MPNYPRDRALKVSRIIPARKTLISNNITLFSRAVGNKEFVRLIMKLKTATIEQ